MESENNNTNKEEPHRNSEKQGSMRLFYVFIL